MGKRHGLSKSECDKIADNMEEYLNAHAMAIVTVTPSSAKAYKEATEVIEDMIRRLREGKTKKVIKSSMIDVLEEDSY